MYYEEYVISDTHFNSHNTFNLGRKNKYLNVKEHDEAIIKNWNSVVGKNDIVYHLGDICENLNLEQLKRILERLNGHKILIKGNHDKQSDEFYLKAGFEKVYNNFYQYNEKVILSHFPIPMDNNYFINIHGHLHNEKIELKNYFNANVDVNFFRPINIKIWSRQSNSLKMLDQPFGKEWYRNSTKRVQTI